MKSEKMLVVDIVALVKKIWSKKFLILFFTLLLGSSSYFASMFLIKPQYSATTRIYVVNQSNQNQTNNISAQDLQAGTYLVSDYREIITSREVLENVIRDNKLNTTYEKFLKKVQVTIPSETRVISITVTDNSPKVAAKLSNYLRKISSKKIKQVTKVQDISLLEVATTPIKPSSPNLLKNALLGSICGAFITIVLITIKFLLDDRVKTADDVEEILGMTLLGIVPNINKL